MPFEKNAAFAEDVGTTYGEYESTFVSENGQVRAELFRQGEILVAFVSFANGRQLQDITDRYHAALEKHAAEIGFAGKLRILFPET